MLNFLNPPFLTIKIRNIPSNIIWIFLAYHLYKNCKMSKLKYLFIKLVQRGEIQRLIHVREVGDKH